jgi:hypothetical protein
MTLLPADANELEAQELAALQLFLLERSARGPLVERVLVAGSRNWSRVRILRMAIQMLPRTATLVEGDAAGVDRVSGIMWRSLGGAVEPHPLPER